MLIYKLLPQQSFTDDIDFYNSLIFNGCLCFDSMRSTCTFYDFVINNQNGEIVVASSPDWNYSVRSDLNGFLEIHYMTISNRYRTHSTTNNIYIKRHYKNIEKHIIINTQYFQKYVKDTILNFIYPVPPTIIPDIIESSSYIAQIYFLTHSMWGNIEYWVPFPKNGYNFEFKLLKFIDLDAYTNYIGLADFIVELTDCCNLNFVFEEMINEANFWRESQKLI